ncbi:caspase family protein [Sorangium sp. KYC3313]|uniref:caspase family protein n=1 Tax=Sorangium sp. KYC3313 TaxID=3449740 RepID=UPI003F8A4BCF
MDEKNRDISKLHAKGVEGGAPGRAGRRAATGAIMSKRALIVGIDEYTEFPQLTGAVADARAMADVLRRNDDKSINYDCRLLAGDGSPKVTRAALQRLWRELFSGFKDPILFFFAGHGLVSETGGYICTSDGTPEEPGLPMNDLIVLANKSTASEVLIILDCCHSGTAGGSPYNDALSVLREGVTLLAASRPSEKARERFGRGVFSGLLCDALRGGGANLRGQVTAADLYAYADQALGAWDQRPLYKSYSSGFSVIRQCTPLIADDALRSLIELFPSDDAEIALDPSYEHTQPEADPKNVAKFDKLKALRNAGLVHPTRQPDLYWSAVRRGGAALTPWGRRYWRMAQKDLI